MSSNDVLKIDNLNIDFKIGKFKTRVVKNINLSVKKGKVTVLVGESGSGKSVTANAILDLLDRNGEIAQGNIFINGKNIRNMSKKEKNMLRGNEVGMIFQNPVESLNPTLTIGTLVSETVRINKKMSKRKSLEEAVILLEKVHLNNAKDLLDKYPFQLSGGMCQRVMIAIAMSRNPSLLIADEPTTALDVTVQAEVLKEICKMGKEFNTGILFITHDLGIVAEIADYVYVMKDGEIVESNDVFNIFNNPQHEYTKSLLDALI